MGFTELGDPFVRSCLILLDYPLLKLLIRCHRLDQYWTNLSLGVYHMRVNTSPRGSQVMACHVPLGGSCTPSYSCTRDDQTSQCGRRGSHDHVRDHGPRVGATTVAPATLSYEPIKAL
jgi:hypothetical protein